MSEFACFYANWSLPLPVWRNKKSESACFKQTGRYLSQFGVITSLNLPISKQTGRYRSQFGVRKSLKFPVSKQTGATTPSLAKESPTFPVLSKLVAPAPSLE